MKGLMIMLSMLKRKSTPLQGKAALKELCSRLLRNQGELRTVPWLQKLRLRSRHQLQLVAHITGKDEGVAEERGA